MKLNRINQTNIEVYVDEIEPETECNFIILGSLFIKKNKKEDFIKKLINSRTPDNRKLDNLNDFEVHFTEIREGRTGFVRKTIIKRWLEIFANNNNNIFVNILYIDLTKLDATFFGDDNNKANIYNKFFRTLIDYGLKCFFSNYDKIIIEDIFYDKKDELERHYFFNNENLNRLEYKSDGKFLFVGKIIFIESNHKKEKEYPKESQIIQFIDLIIGSIRHNVFYIAKDKMKTEVSFVIRKKLLGLKAEYWSDKTLKVGFFPKNHIKSSIDLDRNNTFERNDEFYNLSSFDFKMPAQETTLNNWF